VPYFAKYTIAFPACSDGASRATWLKSRVFDSYAIVIHGFPHLDAKVSLMMQKSLAGLTSATKPNRRIVGY